MFRTSKSPVTFAFERAGGSIIIGQIDVWKATSKDWQLVSQIKFSDVTAPSESKDETLPKGDYTCVFQCFVQESLNGKYEFELDVAKKSTYLDSGDCNTTSAPNDTKVYKDQFLLEVA